VVVSLELGADLRMAQLMPLPLTFSCFTRAYSKRVPRTNCALRIKKYAPRISSGVYFSSTSYLTNNVVFNLFALTYCYFG